MWNAAVAWCLSSAEAVPYFNNSSSSAFSQGQANVASHVIDRHSGPYFVS